MSFVFDSSLLFGNDDLYLTDELGSQNKYQYCVNNPINYYDSNEKWTLTLKLGADLVNSGTSESNLHKPLEETTGFQFSGGVGAGLDVHDVQAYTKTLTSGKLKDLFSYFAEYINESADKATGTECDDE